MSRKGSALSLLRAHGLSPKKSFGQNFLHDERAIQRIAELATTPPGGTVLELGAGLGALTRALLPRAGRVVAVERDRDLVPLLEEDLGQQQGLIIREADAAKLDWKAELEAGPPPRVVAGNLPYQITGRLIETATHLARELDRVVFMVQLEVADRVVAKPGEASYGALSVFVQAAFEAKKAFKVPAGAFVPAPKVDSAVLVMNPHGAPRAVETDSFREVVRRAFGQRRKTLRNAWRRLGDLEAAQLEELAREAGVSLDARGETLSVEDFARVAGALDRLAK